MKLFSLFRRSPAQAVPAPPPPLPEGVLPLAYDEYGFARPDWRTFEAWLASQPETSHADWRRAADRQWLEAVQAMAPDRWTITPSQRFLLLHPTQLPERIGAYTTLLEKLTTRLGMMLPELARPPQGQMPVLIFAAEHDYQVYSTHYYPEYGEYGLSGGMFLAEGGGHIALPYFGFRAAEPVIAHELTHACLHHCALPRWLDEGLAVAFEHASYPRPRGETPFEQQRAHQALWTTQSIQRFWSGASFFDSNEHQSRSYELAQVLVEGLSRDRPRFLSFLSAARRSDAGEMAARQQLGFSLGDAAATYLGEGEWAPRSRAT